MGRLRALYADLSRRRHRRRVRVARRRGERLAARDAGYAGRSRELVLPDVAGSDADAVFRAIDALTSPAIREIIIAQKRVDASPRCNRTRQAPGGSLTFQCGEPAGHDNVYLTPHVDRRNGHAYWCAHCGHMLDPHSVQSGECAHCRSAWYDIPLRGFTNDK